MNLQTMEIMNITKEQLPVKKFERLGIHRERLDKMVAEEQNTLLRGLPTSTKFLVFRDGSGKEHKVNARLSLYRTNDGELNIKVHPFRKQVHNELNLTGEELHKLKSRSTVIKDLKAPEVKMQGTYLVQLDTQTNELRWVRTDQIRFNKDPHAIPLSRKEISSLMNGQLVSFRQKDGKTKNLELDLFHPKLIKMQTGRDYGIKTRMDDESKPSRQRGLKR